MSAEGALFLSIAAGIRDIFSAIFLFVFAAVRCGYQILERSSKSIRPDEPFLTQAIKKFLNDLEIQTPVSFSAMQISNMTANFATLLGSGGFGKVYKGILQDGTMVAVKVLHGSSDKRIEEQFMAEVNTIGRIHHFNLVRLHGFCLEQNRKALVYEYMENGSLDSFLFQESYRILEFEKLHKIAIGAGKGIAYLHEECHQRIIHYDIKPANILLDRNFLPKVGDFGLAKLCNRENSHITMTGGRGTPGYAAPELWMPGSITHKCDVYSFGMLLFEIVGRRRNLDIRMSESQEWFPEWVWERIDNGADLQELLPSCAIDWEKDSDAAERILKTALWCVQYRAESRPMMSSVVKMLEGSMEIPTPLNPFPHLGVNSGSNELPFIAVLNSSTADLGFSTSVAGSNVTVDTPVMRNYEIEFVSS